MPATANTDVWNAAASMWPMLMGKEGLKMAAWKLVTMNFPSTSLNPAGVCIQELAASIQKAERAAPAATMHVARKCTPRLTRSQPNSSTARKPDSRKNANIPSAASALPNTSPT